MSKEDYDNQFLALVQLSELNEAEAVLMVLELAILPFQSYVFKHDTDKGIDILGEYHKNFAQIKKYIAQQEAQHVKEDE